MLSRIAANRTVRIFAIFILIVEVIAHLASGGDDVGYSSYMSAFGGGGQSGARDLTTDWINGTEAVRFNEPGVSTLPASVLMLAAAAFAGFRAMRGRAARRQESGS